MRHVVIYITGSQFILRIFARAVHIPNWLFKDKSFKNAKTTTLIPSEASFIRQKLSWVFRGWEELNKYNIEKTAASKPIGQQGTFKDFLYARVIMRA